MKTRIIQYKDMDSSVWNNFVYNNTMGYAYHLYEIVALDRWENDKNKSFCIWDDDKKEPAMIVQLHLEYKVMEYEAFYRLHSRWGYVIKDNLPKREFDKVRKQFTSYIDSLFTRYHIRSYDLSLPPLSEYMMPSPSAKSCIVNPAVYFCFAPSVRYTYIVNLKYSAEELLANCEQTTRADIRKVINGKKYNIVEAESTEADYTTYINMHAETYTRTHAAHAIIREEYQRNIFFNLIPKGICKVYFLENMEKKRIAGTVILIYKNTAYYWWGASLNEKEVGINKYLLFMSMLKIKEIYAEAGKDFWFETGGAYVHLRRGKYKGLNDFKKCFGTQLHPIFTGKYEAVISE